MTAPDAAVRGETPSGPRPAGTNNDALAAPASPAFTVGYVPGVMPGKWLGRWRERKLKPVLQDELVPAGRWRAALEDGTVTACFVRLGWAPEDPGLAELRATHHAVHLYDELQVVVLSTDDVLGVLDALTTEQLAEESTPQPHADVDDAAMAVELAAAGVGPVVLPMSVARLHARKDVTHRELTDAPTVPVALVWPKGLDEGLEDAVQRFVGIVRGRREASGRDEGTEGAGVASSGGEQPPRAEQGGRGKPAGAGGQEKPPARTGGKAQSGGWAKAGASTKPGLRRKPGRKVRNGRNRKRR